MSTLLIIGIGGLVWLLLCVIALAVGVAAQRGDNAVRDRAGEASS